MIPLSELDVLLARLAIPMPTPKPVTLPVMPWV